MITFAKGVTNAAVPMAGVMASKKIYDAFMTGPEHLVELFHGYTYSGHPLAAAAGLATLDIYKDEGLFERAQKLEPVFADAMMSLKGQPNVQDIRTVGLLAGIDLAPIPGKPGLRGYEATERMYHDLNIYVRVASDTLVVAPPLISTEARHRRDPRSPRQGAAGGGSGLDQIEQRGDVREHVVRLRHGRVQRDAAAVDPRDRQAQRLAADHVRELRLAGMQDVVAAASGMRRSDSGTACRPACSPSPAGRADQVEGAPQRRRGKEVVIDVGDHGQPVALGQPVERWRHVGEQRQAGERIEISLDQPGRSLDSEVLEGLRQRQLADVAIAPIGLPIVGDVALLPVLPERLDVGIARSAIGQHRLERRIGVGAGVDQRSEHVERQELRNRSALRGSTTMLA